MISELLGQRHRHLSWARNRPASTLGHQISKFYFVVFRNNTLDIIQANLPVLKRQKILEALFDQIDIKGPARKVGAGDDALQG